VYQPAAEQAIFTRFTRRIDTVTTIYLQDVHKAQSLQIEDMVDLATWRHGDPAICSLVTTWANRHITILSLLFGFMLRAQLSYLGEH